MEENNNNKQLSAICCYINTTLSSNTLSNCKAILGFEYITNHATLNWSQNVPRSNEHKIIKSDKNKFNRMKQYRQTTLS